MAFATFHTTCQTISHVSANGTFWTWDVATHRFMRGAFFGDIWYDADDILYDEGL